MNYDSRSVSSTLGSWPGNDEGRGLAKLRAMGIEFNDWYFARSLSKEPPEAIQAFLDAGMSPGHMIDDMPPLTFLIRDGCRNGQTPETTKQKAKILLAGGADVNQIDLVGGNTALMFAAESCDRTTVRMLLAAGAKMSIRNMTNSSALEGAIVAASPGAEELIAAGARLDPKTAKQYLESYKDYTPRDIAVDSSCPNVDAAGGVTINQVTQKWPGFLN